MKNEPKIKKDQLIKSLQDKIRELETKLEDYSQGRIKIPLFR